MSLVSTYVWFNDKWLKNPVFFNKDLFVCFDDDDPVEVVAKESAYKNNKHHIQFLNDQGFNIATLSNKAMLMGRLHPYDVTAFVTSRCFFVKWLGDIDSSKCFLNIKCDGEFLWRPEQCCFYGPTDK